MAKCKAFNGVGGERVNYYSLATCDPIIP